MRPYRKRHPGRTGDDSYELLLHSSSHPRLDYTAVEEPVGSADSLRKHYIGVYDPATRDLKLVQAHRVVLRSTVRPTERELEDEKVQTPRQTFSALRQSLGMEFGTKKAKKAIEALTVNAISPRKPGNATEDGPPDARTTAVLESMSTTGIPSKEALQEAIDDAKPRPKPNLAAATPAEVYPLSTLIEPQDQRLLQVDDWIKAVANNESVTTPSRFVANRVAQLAAHATKETETRLKALKYLLALITFAGALPRTRSGGAKLPPRDKLKAPFEAFPAPLLDSLRRKFAPGGSALSKWHIDLLMTHAAALALVVDGFATDTHDLREDLRLEEKAMTKYFRELGCRVAPLTEKDRERLSVARAEAKGRVMARLKLPLEFPRQRALPAKRR